LTHYQGYSFDKFYKLLRGQYIKYKDHGLRTTKEIIRSSVDFLKDDEHPISDELLQSICYSLHSCTFAKGESLYEEGQKLTHIIFIRKGLVDVKIRSSLFEEYTMQRLYPGCSYGSNSFFIDDENE